MLSKNSNIGLVKVAIIYCVVSLISACGGGSDGGASPNPSPSAPVTPNQPPIPPENDVADNYSGLRAAVEINSSNAKEIIFHTTLINDVINVLMFADEFESLRFDSALIDYGQPGIGDCDEGENTIELIDDANADVIFKSCVSGPYTINGAGKLAISELSENGDLISGVLEFEALNISSSVHDLELVLKGQIDISVGDVVSGNFNAVIEIDEQSTQYWLNNILVKHSDVGNTDYSIAGRLYQGSLGYFDITTTGLGNMTIRGQVIEPLKLKVVSDKSLWIEKSDSGNLVVALTDNDESVPRYQSFIPFEHLVSSDINANTNSPVAVISDIPASFDQNIVLSLDGTQTTDKDFDVLSFSWDVVASSDEGEFAISFENTAIADITFLNTGTYRITLSVSDGTNMQTSSTEIYIRKNKPEVVFSSNSIELITGEQFEGTFGVSNDDIDGPFEYALEYGPASMNLLSGARLEWDGRFPQYGGDTTVHFGVSVSNSDHKVVSRKTIEVKSESNQPNVFYGGGDIHDQVWLDVNEDGALDMILHKRYNFEAWDLSKSTPELLFNYMGEGASIYWFAYNVERSNFLIYNENNEYIEYSPSTGESRLLFVSDLPSLGSYAHVTDIDNDGTQEIIDVERVRDLETGNIEASFEEIEFSARGINAGDMNGDGFNELLIGLNALSTDEFELIASIPSVDGSATETLLYDVDDDGRDEAVVLSQAIEIYDLVDNIFVLKQRVLSDTNVGSSVSLAFSSDYSELYVASNYGLKISKFIRNESGMYIAEGEMLIDDPLLITNRFDGRPFTPCSLESFMEQSTANKLAIKCSESFVVEGGNYFLNRDVVGVLSFNTGTSSLPRTFPFHEENFLSIQSNADDSFTIGGFRGKTQVSIDSIPRVETSVPGRRLRNSFLNYQFFSIISDEFFGLGIDFGASRSNDTVYAYDLIGNEFASSEPLPSDLRFLDANLDVSGESIISVIDQPKGIVFLQFPSLDLVAKVELSSLSLGADPKLIQTVIDNNDMLIVWGEDGLAFIKLEGSVPSLYQEYRYPDGMSVNDSADLRLIARMKSDENKLLLFESRNRTLTKSEFDLNSLTFSEQIVVLESRVPIDYYSKACMNTLDNDSDIIYLHTHALDNDISESTGFNLPKVITALEPKSGDIVWQSRKLASRERTADISCVTIDDAQAIMLSTPSYLYLAK
ncbi:PKD domain-containing protein [Ningiella sp. W23]|uniref:PKD domain-containing protein n=1 Tax=Ningiella sp. W23 TaxID=3023715 RepID=UPI0037562FA5